EHRHRQVEHEKVGLMLTSAVDGLDAVLGLGHHLEAAAAFQRHLHQVSHVREVVGDDHAKRRLLCHYCEPLRVRLPLLNGLFDFRPVPRARRNGSASGSTSRWLSSISSSPGANGSLISISYSGAGSGVGALLAAATGR